MQMKDCVRRDRYERKRGEVPAAVRTISDACGISPIFAFLLFGRGYDTPEKVDSFLNFGTERFYDPFLLTDMEKAAERVFRALKTGEKIAVYGDYDVDGVTSTTALYLYLKSHGTDATMYIPKRIGDGYGITPAAVKVLADAGHTLMITVDTGITANAEIDLAASLGMETVVTDHHDCLDMLPDACAVVNPKRPGDRYPFRELAGVGVTYKLLCAVELLYCRENGEDPRAAMRRIASDYSDLTALGTIADIMPLLDENRLIVHLGISVMRERPRVGLDAIFEAASPSKDGKRRLVSSEFISFQVAPRLNAAGRMSDAMDSVRLLLCEDPKEAAERAESLCDLNRKRQNEEGLIVENVLKELQYNREKYGKYCIVMDGDDWMPGIIGIVASRVTETYGVPCVLITYSGVMGEEPNGMDLGKGSGRSVPGIHLADCFTAADDLLERHGGHSQAAGLSVRRCNVDAFRERINDYVRKTVSAENLVPVIEDDFEVWPDEITMPLAEELGRMEPCGVANPHANFFLRGMRVENISSIGGGRHVRLQLSREGYSFSGVFFNHPATQLSIDVGDLADIFFKPEVNEFKGNRSLQLLLSELLPNAEENDGIRAAHDRFYEVADGGAAYSAEEGIVPTREDFAMVYRYLRRQWEKGNEIFSERTMLSGIRLDTGILLNCAKLLFCLRAFDETGLCRFEVLSGTVISVKKGMENGGKVDLFASPTLARIRTQCVGTAGEEESHG